MGHFAHIEGINLPRSSPKTFKALMWRHCEIRDCGVWFPKPRFRDPKDYATLAHEMAHATFHVLAGVGVELTTHDGSAGVWTNDEAFTYLQAYLIQETLIRVSKPKEWLRSIHEKRPAQWLAAAKPVP